MRNKLFMATLAASIAIPAVVVPVQASVEQEVPVVASEQSKGKLHFSDTADLNQATQEKIGLLTDKGIILGFEDGTFRPKVQVTRGQYASFIAKALDLPVPKTIPTFNDVTTKVATHDGIYRAYGAGIVSGYTKTRFNPNETISRGQMAIMLNKALQYKGSYPSKATLTYSDSGSIGKSQYEAVERLTHYGVMGAHNGGKAFSPLVKGDRLLTVLSIYELMDVKGLLDDEVIVEPEKPTKPEVEGVVTVKGFKFTPFATNEPGWYQDEIGQTYKAIPTLKNNMQFEKGRVRQIENKPTRFLTLEESDYMAAMGMILVEGVNLEKDDFLNALKQFRETGKPVIINGVKFYYEERANDKSFMHVTLL